MKSNPRTLSHRIEQDWEDEGSALRDDCAAHNAAIEGDDPDVVLLDSTAAHGRKTTVENMRVREDAGSVEAAARKAE